MNEKLKQIISLNSELFSINKEIKELTDKYNITHQLLSQILNSEKVHLIENENIEKIPVIKNVHHLRHYRYKHSVISFSIPSLLSQLTQTQFVEIIESCKKVLLENSNLIGADILEMLESRKLPSYNLSAPSISHLLRKLPDVFVTSPRGLGYSFKFSLKK